MTHGYHVFEVGWGGVGWGGGGINDPPLEIVKFWGDSPPTPSDASTRIINDRSLKHPKGPKRVFIMLSTGDGGLLLS